MRRRTRSCGSIRRRSSSRIRLSRTPPSTSRCGRASSSISETVTGKKVQFFPVQSNAAQLEAMRAGRLHVTGFNTGSNPIAVNCAGIRAICHDGVQDRRVRLRHGDHYLSWLGHRKDRGYQGQKARVRVGNLQLGLQGAIGVPARQVSRWSRTRTIKPVFSGKHDNTILGVANKDYPAGSIASVVKDRMIVARRRQGRCHQGAVPLGRCSRPRAMATSYNSETGARRQDQGGVLLLQLGTAPNWPRNSARPSRRWRSSSRSPIRRIGPSSARSTTAMSVSYACK